MRIALMDVTVVALQVITFRFAFRWLKNNYWCDSQEKSEKDTDSEFMELFTFYSRYKECRSCFLSVSNQCNSPDCSYMKSMRLIDLLGQAKKTLDICIYIFTYEGFYQKLIDVFNSGVKIRLILDHEMALTNGSKLGQLKEKGLDVRLRIPSHIMHHKLFIIDNSLLVTGSLNWTMHALLQNTEQVLVTNKKDFIEKSRIVFEKLWDESNSIQDQIGPTM